MKNGAQYADVYIQSGEGHSVHFEDGKIDEISSSTADGSGSRIIVNGKTFYSHAPGGAAAAIARPLDAAPEWRGWRRQQALRPTAARSNARKIP